MENTVFRAYNSRRNVYLQYSKCILHLQKKKQRKKDVMTEWIQHLLYVK